MKARKGTAGTATAAKATGDTGTPGKPTAGSAAKTTAGRGPTGKAMRKATPGADGNAAGRFTVFLDRDGVFNVHPRVGVRHWRDFEWLPGAREAFARLARPDVQTCLVTNQPTVGLGMTTPGQVRRVNERMRRELADAGGRLDRIEAAFAPPWLPHRRRKPRPGMLEDGAAAFAAAGSPVDKKRAVMVGDKPRDAGAAAAFGIPAILVATTLDVGTLRKRIERSGLSDVQVVEDLEAAVVEILRRVAARGDRPGTVGPAVGTKG